MKTSARLIAILLLVSSITRGQPAPIEDIPKGDDRIVVLRKGDAAPFDGQLFDNGTALRWNNWLQQYKYRLKADVALEIQLHQSDVAFWKKKSDVDDVKYATVTRDYQMQVANLQMQVIAARQDAANPPWYTTSWFGFTAGVVMSALLVSVGAYALHASAK